MSEQPPPSPSVLDQTIGQFIESVAEAQPTPGGGSVAGVVGALGVALGQMTLNYTRGKAKYAEHAADHDALAHRLDLARQMLVQLSADDEEAFGLVSHLENITDPQEKRQHWELGLAAAINVPREVSKVALAVLADLRRLLPIANPFLLTDLMASAALARSAVCISHYNVTVNVRQLPDAQQAGEVLAASGADVHKADKLLHTIEQVAADLLP